MPNLLSIENLSWQVFDKTILNNISFNVARGEVLGIIGPNGAGKTSLLRCITHQNSHVRGNKLSGVVTLENRIISQYSAKELAQHFALVAQKTEAIFSLNVYDIVSMGLLPHKSLFSMDSTADKNNISKALEVVGLSHALSQSFNDLSGGEQQRVLIARALVQGSQILVLDEPTNHLDVYYQHQILRLVTSLQLTVIMTVHDLNLASQYCHRLLLLNKGALVCDGPPEKVLTSELLSNIFRLNCLQEIDSKTGKPRVYFYLEEDEQKQGELTVGKAVYDET